MNVTNIYQNVSEHIKTFNFFSVKDFGTISTHVLRCTSICCVGVFAMLPLQGAQFSKNVCLPEKAIA